MNRILVMCSGLLIFCAAAYAQTAKRAITFDDLISMHRVSDPRLSPDGKWIAYTVATPDKETNQIVSDIWMVGTSGSEPRQITRGGSDQRARWSPDGKKLAFLSGRGGTAQVYSISPAGGEATRLTSVPSGADNELWSPDGKTIAFVSRVYPDCPDEACTAKRDADKAKSKMKARTYTKLLYRHWTQWWDGKRSHLFVIAADGGKARDLTTGGDYDVPPFNLGEPAAISFSPDGEELAFTANTDKDEATSTNGDIFIVPVKGGAEPKRITDNPGDDWGPIYSPDGKWIAYRSQLTPGYESDRWRLFIYDRATGKRTNLTEGFDEDIQEIGWLANSETIYFQAQEKGELPVYAIGIAPGDTPRKILADGFYGEFNLSHDGHAIAFTRTSLEFPPEIFIADSNGRDIRALTHHNGALLAQLDMPKMETFWYPGADQTQIEEFIVRPPNFDPAKKYPMLLLVHGGPQVPWGDSWGYRWNPEVFAAPGYVVVMPNPHGSPGYGSKFTEEISKDWGGKVYTDVMAGVDAAAAKYSFIDGSRVCAAGASYGGFMMDWIATHTDRFKCIISHAGPYNARSMYGATEELWFEEWEYGGTPWANPELYDKWSPEQSAAALGKFKTPTLVTGGEIDFRIPYTQDLEFFTALQRQGVPSKLVIFPNEGHWILQPQDSEYWYHTFLDWLATYLK